MAVQFFKTASNFPNFDDPNVFPPNSTGPWPQLQKGRKIPALNFGLSLYLFPHFWYALVRAFSDVLVAFLYFDICHNCQSNLAIENPEFSQPVVAGHFQ